MNSINITSAQDIAQMIVDQLSQSDNVMSCIKVSEDIDEDSPCEHKITLDVQICEPGKKEYCDHNIVIYVTKIGLKETEL